MHKSEQAIEFEKSRFLALGRLQKAGI